MESIIGNGTIKTEEKLPKPASNFTSSAETDIFRSQSLNRSTESSCEETESLSRTAKSMRGTFSVREVVEEISLFKALAFLSIPEFLTLQVGPEVGGDSGALILASCPGLLWTS
jgi:hypothetical protein